jgi:hypothetical protein
MKSYCGKTCSAMTSEQLKCRAPALAGSEFCFFHDPTKAVERRDAQASGGPAEPDENARRCRARRRRPRCR